MTATKDVFGKPKEGVHRYRFCGIAIVDFGFTVIAACIISYFSHKNVGVVFLFLFTLGVFFHYIFSVDTTLNRLFFGPPSS
jgi:hypothetical protein